MKSNFKLLSLHFSPENTEYRCYEDDEILEDYEIFTDALFQSDGYIFTDLVAPSYDTHLELLCYKDKKIPMSINLFYALGPNSYRLCYTERRKRTYRGRRKR